MAQEFEIVRGTNETLTAYITDQSGNAVDLTGYSSINLYADKALNATSPALTKAVTLVATPSSGQTTFSFTPSDTSSLDSGEYLAEVHITIGSIQYRTLVFIFRIKQRVKL